MLEHLLLIGIDFNPARSTGDKNFWLDMLAHAGQGLRRVTVLSFKRQPAPPVEFCLGGCRVSIRYIGPSLLDGPKTAGGSSLRQLGAVAKTVDAFRLLAEMAAIYRKSPYQHVHLMDNLGIANRLIARYARTRVSVTAFTYAGVRPYFLYDWFLRASFDHYNITVVSYSEAYREKLLRLGIDPSGVRRIQWGVSPDCASVTRPGGRPLILWSGYICPIGREDFMFAHETARDALKGGLDAEFVFAFKPECYEPGFSEFHRPGGGISVMPTTGPEFDALKARAGIFYSPVVNPDVIVGPPLTWLEMLAHGIPIVTTCVPGVTEAVREGVTGFVAGSKAEVRDALFSAASRYTGMAQDCRASVSVGYDIKESARMYFALWEELASAGYG